MSYLLFLLLQPTLVDGTLEARGAATNLEQDILEGADGTFWAGYEVPRVAGKGHGCEGVFHLDNGRGYTSSGEASDGADLYVFYRVVDGHIVETGSVSASCRIDASGRTVHWWSDVTLEASLAFLGAMVREDPSSELAEDALHAIAQHRGRAADELLETFASGDWPLELRKDAVFWMGAARGETGFEMLSRLVESEKDSELREKIVFALHVTEVSGATTKLIELARRDRDAEVREQALFWLAQEAGKRAADTIADAVNEDPELEVKKKAVFALSQLPPDEGIPLLVEVAETHPRPEIRKKAFFWLGQSNDPRALALFEKVLMSR